MPSGFCARLIAARPDSTWGRYEVCATWLSSSGLTAAPRPAITAAPGRRTPNTTIVASQNSPVSTG